MNDKKTLTVFTPTYNRAHTLPRLYDSLCRQTSYDFEWLVIDDGSTDDTRTLLEGYIAENKIPIRYEYKENGGLYTGYNTAYAIISTELNVCVDSDDFMPDNAVELIVNTWKEKGSSDYAGLIGLDYELHNKKPIGGFFPKGMNTCFFLDLTTKRIHIGDSKQVMRTDLMKQVAPQIGFSGEKDFNPVSMLLQACDNYPLLVLNENLCWVEYQQEDSMSRNIFKQYQQSPRSFAKSRLIEMSLKRSTWLNNIRCAIHYVAECLIAKERVNWGESSNKLLILVISPIGLCGYFFIQLKLLQHRMKKLIYPTT
jgi:glycosyltransferase involved in cell wall biosynthesis